VKIYHGHYGDGVDVEENGERRPLDPRFDLANRSPTGFAWVMAARARHSSRSRYSPTCSAMARSRFVITRISNGGS
jgi:hypothetical protein